MLKIMVNGSDGKMGKVLSRCINEDENLQLVNAHKISDIKEPVDVIIDFSHFSLLDEMLDFAINTKTPIVIATTGYSDAQLQQIEDATKIIPIFHSSNMSLGVNILLKLVKEASKALEGFDIEIIEKHHNKKVDAPSGTAIMIANAIKEVLPQSEYNYGRHGRSCQRKSNEIGIHAIRGGTIVGDHDVIFAGGDEIVEINHKAQSKDIFAKGAIVAAKYLVKQQPGYYNMNDMLD